MTVRPERVPSTRASRSASARTTDQILALGGVHEEEPASRLRPVVDDGVATPEGGLPCLQCLGLLRGAEGQSLAAEALALEHEVEVRVAVLLADVPGEEGEYHGAAPVSSGVGSRASVRGRCDGRGAELLTAPAADTPAVPSRTPRSRARRSC